MKAAEKRRILIAEDSPKVVEAISSALQAENFEVAHAGDGHQCLQLIEEFKPDLIFLDLFLPKVHGAEVLRHLKSNKDTSKIGVIVSSTSAMVQDYRAVLSRGADYYLLNPFDTKIIGSVAKDFFNGSLRPTSLVQQAENLPQGKPFYQPELDKLTTYCKFWGTRGSIPVSGLEFHRYGGNTVCLEVCNQKDLVIFDAGTGIRDLGTSLLNTTITDIHLFIGHTHWDHVMGFPFFAPIHQPRFRIHIYAARGFEKSIQELFGGMLDHEYFPVRLEEIESSLIFHDLDGGNPVLFDGMEIHYAYAQHPGVALCFKIVLPNKTIGYASDNEFLVGYHGHPSLIDTNHSRLLPYQEQIDFYTGCDILIHEAQYTPQEYQKKVGWGHSSISNVAILLKHTGCKEWIVTHHDPCHNDTDLLTKAQIHRRVLHDLDLDCNCFMAYDGQTLDLS